MSRLRRLALAALILPTLLGAAVLAPLPGGESFVGTALAVQPDEMLADPALEARARQISEGLRCLVCQNQSIDDSEAPLARDLRLLVRERLKAGDSNQAVRDFLVARYGEFILLRPPFAWNTLALWTLPFLVLLAGAFFALRRARRPAGEGMGPALTEAEQSDLKRILGSE